MKIRFTPRATQDLVDIADYISKRSPKASLHVRAAILDSLQTLTLFPEAGRSQKMPSVRKLVTRKYSYLVYYRIDAASNEAIIVTIQHPARDRPYEDG
ncbi:MAG TPA: type II toxin-antitoxin system RelE/ParE family toxin [Xanthobacteraceae bacterium]|jgi:toxin ParE1/3/4|nr:type II toxin-antitoxin system RelE/ParE family toxin [Xanthobacteraceae bacterium]